MQEGRTLGDLHPLPQLRRGRVYDPENSESYFHWPRRFSLKDHVTSSCEFLGDRLFLANLEAVNNPNILEVIAKITGQGS